jgi:putative tricarboxylic transport membrane protein
MEQQLTGLLNILHFDVLFILVIGVACGIMIGALPGLTATMGVALLLPITFGMEAVTGILLLIGIYFGAIYGGSISAILLRTPGTPAAAATTLDGYPMAQGGLAWKALQISTLSSGIGGFLSVIVLIILAPILANFALRFGAPETFALAVFGLSIISSIAGKSMIKGLMAGTLGLLIGTIGLDPITGFPRYTFGEMKLINGIYFIPVMIGLFAAAEAFRSMEKIQVKDQIISKLQKTRLSIMEAKGLTGTILRSTGIGTLIGMIPGAGGDIACFVAYNEAKRFSKNTDEFGKGALKGVAAPEAANNATTGGAMVPLLTLGIPGDAVTAVLLGALMIQGMQPGPLLFQHHGDVVYSLFWGMLLANLLIIVMGFLGIRFFVKVLAVPKYVITPIILILCVVGSYALQNSFFDVWIMFAAGVIGYFMQRYGFPASPIILALILGPMAESNLRRSLVMSQGDPSIFFTRPITVILLFLAVMTLFTPLFRYLWLRKKGEEQNTSM